MRPHSTKLTSNNELIYTLIVNKGLTIRPVASIIGVSRCSLHQYLHHIIFKEWLEQHGYSFYLVQITLDSNFAHKRGRASYL